MVISLEILCQEWHELGLSWRASKVFCWKQMEFRYSMNIASKANGGTMVEIVGYL